MALHTLDIAEFRGAFPAFANSALYPPELLQFWWGFATCELCPNDSAVLNGECLQRGLMLCLAHILTIIDKAAKGRSATGAITSAAIDKVSVGYTAPPYSSGWQYWLSLTPYGLLLRSLLSSKAAGGFYIGGWPEADGFRKIGGVF